MKESKINSVIVLFIGIIAFVLCILVLSKVESLKTITTPGEYITILLVVVVILMMAYTHIDNGISVISKVIHKSIINEYLKRKEKKEKKKLEDTL